MFVGFILSLKKELHKEWQSVPDNVLLTSWVPQNDLLGDKRLNAFITHGGLNSILESLFHAKPMIVIGTSIDQVNGAVVVDYRKLGIGITSDRDITYVKLTDSINRILSEEQFINNCKVASKYVKAKDGKETFYYWLDYILSHGTKHLIISSELTYSLYQIHNVDVFLVWAFIIYLAYKVVFLIISRCFFSKKENK